MRFWKRIGHKPKLTAKSGSSWARFEPTLTPNPGSSWTHVFLPAIMPSPVAAESVEVTAYASTNDWFVDAVLEVSRLAKLPPDWDTYGSPAVTEAAKRCALTLLTGLGRSHLPMPDVGAVSGGGLQFEWNVGPRALELEVLPDGSLEFLRAYEDDRMSEGRIPTNGVERLREQVNWLVQHPA